MKKANDVLADKNSKKDWHEKRRAMLKDKIDVTKFMHDFLLGYPETFKAYLARNE